MKTSLNQNYITRMNRRSIAEYWLGLALFSLIISGFFAFFIAAARTPVLQTLVQDVDFFRRALIVHVDLGVLVWFTAFPVALFSLLNEKSSPSLVSRISSSFALSGILLLILVGFFTKGTPFLANYVPIISHPLFLLGLGLFVAGVGANYLSHGLLTTIEPSENDSLFRQGLYHSQFGIRVGALFFLVSIPVLVMTLANTPSGLDGKTFYETLMWGAGHTLQCANAVFMVVCWILLLTSWLGKSPVTRRQAFNTFAWMALPLLIIPWAAAQDPAGAMHRETFTQIMRWGIFPPVLYFLACAFPQVVKSKNEKRKDVRFLSFVLSSGLIVTGFIFGAFVRGPDLRMPGHYHASIGAVTLSFMGAAYILVVELQKSRNIVFSSPVARANALFYGCGQFVFALGMFIAGCYGMGRKLYANEQQIRNLGQTIGLWTMGAGGAFALLGGFIFAGFMIRIFTRKLTVTSCKQPTTSRYFFTYLQRFFG